MQVTDSGATFTPLVLHLPAAEGDWHLQELIWQWEAQASQRALHHSPQLLCLCLARYGHHDGAARKNCSVVRFGHESVACATFTDPNSLTVTQTEYRTQSVIVHLGQSTRHGHYRAFLSHRGSWFYTDDNRVARLAECADMSVLQCQSYLIWLSQV